MTRLNNAVEWYQVDSPKATRGATWHLSLPHTRASTGCYEDINALPLYAVRLTRDIPPRSCFNCRRQYRLYLAGLMKDPRLRPRLAEITVAAS